MEVKKAIIPAAGLCTRFLPLTKVSTKELLPLAGEPMISYVAREAKESGASQIIFVLSEDKKNILKYFKKDQKLESILLRNNKKKLWESLRKISQDFEGVTISAVFQPLPRGDGDAVLRAKKQIGREAFGVLFSDDIFESKIPALLQLIKIFKTSQKPVVGLCRVREEKLSGYGVVGVEKIAHRLYKIKEIIEKPAKGQAPSNLAIVGRYVFPPEIFNYLAKTPAYKTGELILAEALKLMLKDGKIVYGLELEGKWLECGRTSDWLKSNLYLSLKHPIYGPMLREFLKKIK